MRFRFFTYVITTDNIKMYRQILMHPSQTRLQKILWRNNPSANGDTYELTTITYGTASASFLATGCLKYLAEQHAPQFTRGSACVLRDFYVDAQRSRYNRRIETNSRWNYSTIKIRSIRVSKWASNCSDLLETNNRLPVIIRDNAADSCPFWACNRISVRIHFNLSAILIQNLMLYQNESYFPSLDCSILWAFWVQLLWSQSSSCKTCGNWPSNGTSLFLRTSILVGSLLEHRWVIWIN